MAHDELKMRLKEQLEELNMALMTATNGEVAILESLRMACANRLAELSTCPQLKAA